MEEQVRLMELMLIELEKLNKKNQDIYDTLSSLDKNLVDLYNSLHTFGGDPKVDKVIESIDAVRYLLEGKK
jgi:hypothetical protein